MGGLVLLGTTLVGQDLIVCRYDDIQVCRHLSVLRRSSYNTPVAERGVSIDLPLDYLRPMQISFMSRFSFL